MSFQSPIYLLALLAVPASVAVYMFADRRRRAGAARFASPMLMPSVAPSGPGFRRHLPLAFYVVALAAVALALARPEATVAVPEERAAVVLTTDVSGSMEARDVRPSRMTAVRRAALDFLEGAPDGLRIGAVAFNHAVRRIQPPRADREDTRALIQELSPSGGTATGEGLAAAVGLISRPGSRDRKRPPAAVILLSDGASTHGRDPVDVARQAARLRIPIYTVAFGTDQGTIEVRGPERQHDHAVSAARPGRDAARGHHQRRADLQRERGRRAGDGLRAARLAGCDARGAPRGDGRVRGRRGGVPAARRGAVAALVRPAALRFGPMRSRFGQVGALRCGRLW